MWAVAKSVFALLVSLVVAFALVIVVEAASNVVHPFPPDMDPHDIEACKAHVARYPAWVLAVAAVAWGLTVYVAAWIATRLGYRRHPAHGIAIGLLLYAAAAFNMLMLPYPLWFEAANFVLMPILMVAASRRAGRTLPPQPPGP